MKGLLIFGLIAISCTTTKTIGFQPAENSYEYCQDGLDNDENGWTDCDDQDCSVFAICHKELPAPITPPDQTEENKTLETCQDNKDNDEDGWIDCADQDCVIYVVCVQPNRLEPEDTIEQHADASDITNIHVLDIQLSDNQSTVDSVNLDQAVVPPTLVDAVADIDLQSEQLPDLADGYETDQSIVIMPSFDTTIMADNDATFDALQSITDLVSTVDAPLTTDLQNMTDNYDQDQLFWPIPNIDTAVDLAIPPSDSYQTTDTILFDSPPTIDLSLTDSLTATETQNQETTTNVDAQTDAPLPPIEEPEEFPGPICEMNPNGDEDDDGLLNSEECAIGSDWQNPDTDNDGLSDYLDLSPVGNEGGGSCFLMTDNPLIAIKPDQGFLIPPLKVPAIIANGWYYSSTDKICPLTNWPFQPHLGLDYFVGKGTDIVASCDGYAVADQQPWNNGSPEDGAYGFGIMVIIRCDKPIVDTNEKKHILFVATSHLWSAVPTLENGIRKDFHLKPQYGLKVVAGQLIGKSGKSGNQSWWHLDFRTYLDEYAYTGNFAENKNSLDPYDIRAKTTKTGCSSANWYPKNALACDFNDCGPKHLWKECPPVAACDNTECANQSPYSATIPGAYIPYNKTDETKNNCKNNSLIKDSCFDQCPNGYTSCNFLTEKCANGVDDDEDNKTDCFDSDCWTGAECAPMIESVICDSCEQGETNVTCTIQGTNFLKTDLEFNVWIEDFNMNNASKKLISSNKIEVTNSWLCDKPVGFKKAAYRHPGSPTAPAGCISTNYSSCQEKAVDVWSGCDGAECGTDLCGENCGNCNNGAWCDYFSGVDYGLCYGGICEGGGNDSLNCCTPNCSNKQCGDDGCGVSCGNCTLPHASTKCVDYKCDIDLCQAGYNNCNANAQDGCEVAGPCGGCPICTTLVGTNCVSVSNGIDCSSDNNACTNDLCQDGQCKHPTIVCNSPPTNECLGNSLRVYNNAGVCANGLCSYSYADTLCQFGCTVKQCAGDPCLGISCLNPPAPTCGQNKKIVYNTPGVCSGGVCSYPLSTEISCDDSVACTIDSCEKGTCTNIPKVCVLVHASAECSNNVCVIVSCENEYNDCNGNPTDGCEVAGPCDGCPECTTLSGTSCIKVQNLTTCSPDNNSCTKDFCNEGNCQHVAINCYSQKPNECSDNFTLKIWNPQGACVNGFCVFENYTLQNCSFGCSAVTLQCLNDPCNGVSCNSPPTPYCNNSNISKIIYNSPGVCSWGICNYNSYTETSCIDSSNCTDDYCVGGDCINPQKANTCGSKQCGWSSDGCFNCGSCSQGECDSQGQCVIKECNPGDSDWQMCDPTPGQYDYCSFEQTKTCTSQGKWSSWGACQGDQFWFSYEYSVETNCGNTICITIDDIDANGNVKGYISRKDGAKWGDYYIDWVVKDDNGSTLDEPAWGDHCFPIYVNDYEIYFDFNVQKLNLGVASLAKIQATVKKGGSGITNCSTYTMPSGKSTIQRCY